MTKKLGISLVASAILMVAAANAADGAITRFNGTGKTSISYEKIEVTEVNVSAGAFAFTPEFSDPSTRTNPVFEYKFTGLDVDDTALENSLGNSVVAEINASYDGTGASNGVVAYVSDTPSVNDGVITYGQLDSANVKAGKQYAIVNKDTNDSADVNLTIPQKDHAIVPTVGVVATVYTGDTGDLLSTAKDTIFTEIKEYTASVETKLNARINLCDARHTFTSLTAACGLDSNVTDSVTFQITRAAVDYPFLTDLNESNVVLGYDANLTNVVVSDANGSGNEIAIASVVASDFKRVASLVDSNLTDTQSKELVWALTVDGNVSIPSTKFNWAFNLAGSEGNTTAANGLAGDATWGSAGEWKPFGYYAQIPNVTDNATYAIQTNIVVANNGTQEEPIIFTLTANGKTCVLDSQVSDVVSAIAGQSTTTYTASSLLAACQADLGEGTTQATVSIDVPTTPEDISVFASWIRDISGVKQFKDLPVYHTGALVQ